MSAELFILILLVITAVGFDFTNGFHDTGNAMATSIATGALKPKTAVALSAILNLVGGFLSVEVAVTVTTSVLKIQQKTGGLVSGIDAEKAMFIIFAGLIGGILWNLLTWLFGLPSSSSHALFGGLIGAGLAAIGTSGINWDGLVVKVIIPAVLSPFIAGAVASLGTWGIYALTKKQSESRKKKDGFRWGQVATASLVSLAHGTGDAQKTMGVIALALIAHGSLTDAQIEAHGLPVWIIVLCAGAIALGTYIGGWRVIRTLGKGLVEIEAPQGMAAQASAAAIILTSSNLGMALSTTHVTTGSIIGSGVGKPGAAVRWSVAGRMATGWIVTLPCAAIGGAVTYFIGHLIGGAAGAVVIFLILVALSAYIYYRAQQQKVGADNVNADWDESSNSVVPAAAHAGSATKEPVA
ncbi:inorganic phosphate transporter [Flexivirga caeni]|uniref:Phosphate transporter n=1 Tax=Flexivirga caeni TaxID=2294115 RepID=A0A3M9M8E3_9MICO|nr:inorganic phosphate transporter [Flexivirga caeni]RNI21153.1 inorganic phosphate transporter [Flexivirga caeni]